MPSMYTLCEYTAALFIWIPLPTRGCKLRRFETAASGLDDPGLREVTMRAVAETLGSMGYFYGSSLVQMDDDTR